MTVLSLLEHPRHTDHLRLRDGSTLTVRLVAPDDGEVPPGRGDLGDDRAPRAAGDARAHSGRRTVDWPVDRASWSGMFRHGSAGGRADSRALR